eukprot:TRINITY_DN33804_c0_g1_i1.p2 TRINITY_DN33804_c0_g1~~TRINITY_DN33804_c0_g1_i1.p2  ORF type:complete len:198 (+),score=-15.50 TRINITY_DN33804_c0_g1_i1:49-642(+)
MFTKKKNEQWPDFGCEGIKVQRAHQPQQQSYNFEFLIEFQFFRHLTSIFILYFHTFCKTTILNTLYLYYILIGNIFQIQCYLALFIQKHSYFCKYSLIPVTFCVCSYTFCKTTTLNMLYYILIFNYFLYKAIYSKKVLFQLFDSMSSINLEYTRLFICPICLRYQVWRFYTWQILEVDGWWVSKNAFINVFLFYYWV